MYFFKKDPYSDVNNDLMISRLIAVLESPLETETYAPANICEVSLMYSHDLKSV